MPGLMEDIARRRIDQRSRGYGVSVYSPTRPLRPSGQLANAGTARRIQGGQQQEEQQQTPRIRAPGVRGSLPGIPLPGGAPAAPVAGQPPTDYLELIRQARAQAEPVEQAGGFLGTVVNTLPGRIAFGALDVLDRPRRAVAATIQEGLDAIGINADSRSDGDASWGDWWDQFSDPSFGFGDIIAETGNKWIDRTIGFVGDVALDPLTYVGGSGLISGTGARARVGLAARAGAAGIAPDLARRSGRRGIQALSNVERQAINAATEGGEKLLDRGYYLNIPFSSKVARIPGTGPLEQAVGGTMAGIRAGLAQVRPMSTMRYWRSERGLQDAIGKILTGRGEISFGVATSLINYRKGAGIASNRALGLLSAEFGRLQREHGDRALNQMIQQTELGVDTPLKKFFDQAADIIEKEGGIRPTFSNYIPHIATDGGIEWMKNTPEGQAFKNEFFKEIDFDDLSPHLLKRRLTPRDKPYVINGKAFTIKDGSIKELNDQFKMHFPELEFKLFDDEISSIVARYSKSISKSVGEAGGLLYLANQAKGLVRYADDDTMLREILDQAATQKLNSTAGKVAKQKISAAKDLAAQLKRETDSGVTGITGAMESHLRRLADTMDSLDPQMKSELDELIERNARLSAEFDSLNAKTPEQIAAEAEINTTTSRIVDELDARYEKVTARLAEIEPAYQLAEQRWREMSQAAKRAAPAPPDRKEYRELVVEAAQLEMDRSAATSIQDRMTLAQRKAEIIERNIDNPTFLNQVAGTDWMPVEPIEVRHPVTSFATEGVETPLRGEPQIPVGGKARTGRFETEVQREIIDPRRPRTTKTIYNESNAARAAAIVPFAAEYPALQMYQNQIEVATEHVLRAEREVFAKSRDINRNVTSARIRFNDIRQQISDLTALVEATAGDPMLSKRHQEYIEQVKALQAPGGRMEQAKNGMLDAQRPMVAARKTYEDAVAEVERLKRLQESEALRIPTGQLSDATSDLPMSVPESLKLQSDLANLERQRGFYLATPAGRADRELAEEVRVTTQAIDANQKAIDAWKPQYRDDPIPFEIRNGHIEPRYGGLVLSADFKKAVPLAASRDQHITHVLEPLLDEQNELMADVMRLGDDLADTIDPGRRTALETQIDALHEQLDSVTDRIKGARNTINDLDKRLMDLGGGVSAETLGKVRMIDPTERRRTIQGIYKLFDERNRLTSQREALVARQTKGKRRLQSYNDTISDMREQLRVFRDAQAALPTGPRVKAAQGPRGEIIHRREAGTVFEHLKPINARERNRLQTAQRAEYGYKLNWEPLDLPLKTDVGFGRHEVWTPQERTQLSQAYTVVDAVDRIPRAARTAEQSNWRDEAVRTIRVLTDPSRDRGGLTYRQVLLRNIIESYDDEGLTAALHETQAARRPFSPPAQRSKIGKALASGSTKGGAHDIKGVARKALQLFDDLNTEFGQQFVDAGSISPGTMAFFQHKSLQLRDALERYGSTKGGRTGGQSPMLLNSIDQLGKDLNRYSEFMFTYRAAINAGVEPSPSVAAFILADRLDREMASELNALEHIDVRLGNKDINEVEIGREHNRMMISSERDQIQNKIDDLESIKAERELTDDEKRQLRNLQGQRNRRDRALDALPADPPVSILSEEVESIVYLADNYIANISEAATDYWHAKDIIKDFGSTVLDAQRAEVHVTTLTSSIAHSTQEQAHLAEAIHEVQENLFRYGVEPEVDAEGFALAALGDSPPDPGMVRYVPSIRNQRYRMTPEEVLEEAKAKTPEGKPKVDIITHNRRKQLVDKAKDEIRRAREDPAYQMQDIEWGREISNNQPVEMSLGQALDRWEKNEQNLVSMRWSLERTKAELAAYRDFTDLYVTHYRRMIQDASRPPEVNVLRGERRTFEHDIEVQGRAPTEREAVTLQLMDERLDMLRLAANDPPTQHELAAMERKAHLYEQMQDNHRKNMGVQEAYVAAQSINDSGRALFTDVVTGGRKATAQDVEQMKSLFGSAEEAELAATFLTSFRQLIEAVESTLPSYEVGAAGAVATPGVSREIAAENARLILNEMRAQVGDSEMLDKAMLLVAEAVDPTGQGNVSLLDLDRIEGRLEASQVGGSFRTREMGEDFQDVGAANYDEIYNQALANGADELTASNMASDAVSAAAERRSASFNFGNIETQIINSMVASAEAAKDTAMQDMNRIFRLLGFDKNIPIDATEAIKSFPTTGVRGRLRMLGYNAGTGKYTDKEQLTRFVTEIVHGKDYDYTHALKRRRREKGALLGRLRSMRGSLGALVTEDAATRMNDPDGFLDLMTKWRYDELDQVEDGAKVIGRAQDYANHLVPDEMEQVYSNRLETLKADFAQAVEDDDLETVNAIGAQIRELVDAGRPVRELPAEAPILEQAAQSPVPTEQVVAEGVAAKAAVPAAPPDAPKAQGRLEIAQAELERLTSQRDLLAAQGGESVAAQAAPTQAQTLDELLNDGSFEPPPGTRMSMAERLMVQRDHDRLRKSLPPRSKRTPQQQADYSESENRLSQLTRLAWNDEPEWQVDVAEAIAAHEANGTPLPWGAQTPSATEAEIARLEEGILEAQANVTHAQDEVDRTPVGSDVEQSLADIQGPSPDVAAQRAQLQAQADAARAAGDENAARYAEQQMGWLDQPEEATEVGGMDPVEQLGVAADPDAPPVLEAPPIVQRTDPTSGATEVFRQRQELDNEFEDIVDEFKALMKNYGPYENMPENIKQRLAALSASARRLSEDRRVLANSAQSSHAETLASMPELATYLERMKQVKPVVQPSITSDWETVLRYGGPSQHIYERSLESKFTPRHRMWVGGQDVQAGTMGSLFGGNYSQRRWPQFRNDLGRQEANLTAQLEASPRKRLGSVRDQLLERLSAAHGGDEVVEEAAEAVVEATPVDLAAYEARYKAARAAEMDAEDTKGITLDELLPLRSEAARTWIEFRNAVNAAGTLPGGPEVATGPGAVAGARGGAEALRGERDRLTTEAADIAAERQRQVQYEAIDAGQHEHTQKLNELQLDVAVVRTELHVAQKSVADTAALRAKIERVMAGAPKEPGELDPYFADLRDLATGIRGLEPDVADTLTTLLANAEKSKRALDAARVREDVISRNIKGFAKDPKKAKAAGMVFRKVALDGWEPVGSKLLRYSDDVASVMGQAQGNLREGDAGRLKSQGLRVNTGVIMAQELRQRLEQVTKIMQTPEPWKLIDKYTAFFKTYATARPGFHVRNALSAVFMNLVDNVSIRNQLDALRIWRGFTRDPMNFYANANAKTRMAIDAVFASGAGGQFAEAGVGTVVGPASKAYRKLMNNKFTEWNRRAGTMVEGSARMGMALDSMRRGQSLEAAVDRVTKYHFNYRELSSLDVQARRFIPFWTFMSRNLPLQLEQMWLRPQKYLQYQSLVRNFSEPGDPLTPEYWLSQGAFTMDENIEERDSPWLLAPDLPHLRVTEPFDAMMRGEMGKALLSDVNPLFLAPLEAAAFNRKVYTGAPLEETYHEPSAAMYPLLPLMKLLGGTETGGTSGNIVLDDRYAHVARSLNPVLDLVERFTDTSGVRAGRQDETFARNVLGLPVLQLTPELRRSTARRNRAERTETRETQTDLARL